MNSLKFGSSLTKLIKRSRFTIDETISPKSFSSSAFAEIFDEPFSCRSRPTSIIFGLAPIDFIFSIDSLARESIEKIKSIGANPKIMLVGLDRQEKGSSNISAKAELENDFGLIVSSIVNLDLLISFVSDDPNFKEFKSDLEEYRNNWGA